MAGRHRVHGRAFDAADREVLGDAQRLRHRATRRRPHRTALAPQRPLGHAPGDSVARRITPGLELVLRNECTSAVPNLGFNTTANATSPDGAYPVTPTGTYRITDWEPYEISLVSVPADTTVGVERRR